jgi:hypothetical protein
MIRAMGSRVEVVVLAALASVWPSRETIIAAIQARQRQLEHFGMGFGSWVGMSLALHWVSAWIVAQVRH